ncbi:hypothetical protein CG710_015360 [Lachnotalea glycerini]|uniref:Uncharacterized protein n=2 Tax=Lachnotalea glycerini TaxID=1763509 RepID=A0A371JC19_9FIRM|nr:hypothetical protein CG710_015360 [Lachnotalea glycerini]
MSRINKDYLLNKISNRSVFYLEESRKETIKTVKKYGIPLFEIKSGKHMSKIIKEIKDIEYGCSEEYFLRKVESIVPNIDFESIEIIKEYPSGSVVIADIFEKYIQPKIKEEYK